MSGNGPPTLSRSSGWSRGVQSNIQMSGPRVGYSNSAVSQHLQASSRSPRGSKNSRSFQPGYQGGGKLTFSKQREQGNHVMYSRHDSTPLQDQSEIQAKHHVEARNFGCGLTDNGPGDIPQSTQELLGQLDAIVKQAEIVVNRLARDIRTAEDQRAVGKLRPRLLRAASSAEKTVMQAQAQVNGQIAAQQLGRTNQIDPRTGRTEADLVQLFTVRLETAARKIYTLGFETPGTEVARRKYATDSLKNCQVYSPPSARNLVRVRDDDGVAGTYGRYQQPQIYTASVAFKD